MMPRGAAPRGARRPHGSRPRRAARAPTGRPYRARMLERTQGSRLTWVVPVLSLPGSRVAAAGGRAAPAVGATPAVRATREGTWRAAARSAHTQARTRAHLCQPQAWLPPRGRGGRAALKASVKCGRGARRGARADRCQRGARQGGARQIRPRRWAGGLGCTWGWRGWGSGLGRPSELAHAMCREGGQTTPDRARGRMAC
jgi:hypothetical protein